MTTTPTLWRDADQINTTDEPGENANASATNVQSHSTVVALTGGRYLVAWEDSSSKFAAGLEPRDIVGQIYDAFGNAIGNEIGLSVLYQDLEQQLQDITALPNGGFAVAYQTTDAAMAGDLENITVEIFDSNGSWSNTHDFRQGFGGTPDINDISPTIASFANGSYVLAYASDAANSGSYDISAYVVAADGTKGPAIAIEATAASSRAPEIAVLSNQDFVVVYEVSGNVKYAIRTSAGGTVASGNIAATASAESTPAVSAFAAGGFVTAWADNAGDGAGNAGIKARVFTNAGVGGTVISINTNTTGTQDDPAVTVLADGTFVVAWRDDVTDTIEGARFDTAGAIVGVQFTIASVEDCSEPSLALLSDGRFVATFTSTDATANPDVFGAIWDPRTGPVIGTSSADILTSRHEGATVSGGAGKDQLYGMEGNDRLEGGADADTLTGGLGNDTYYETKGDTIVEYANGGIDTVESSLTFSLASLANVENIVLIGTNTANAAGNALANSLTGNSAANILNGNTGADTMTGGLGNDIYYVDHASDRTIEAAGGGIDTVSSSVSRTLSVYIEKLNLSGTANIDGNGNTIANTINGNAGNNILRGYEGADTLNGAAGSDILLGGTATDGLNPGNDAVKDTIRFSAVGDSTGSQRDIVVGLDLNFEDVLDFTVKPTSLAFVTEGTLDVANINPGLAAAVNDALAVNGAVLFSPTNIAGHDFLVVDANGDGVYKPSQDYVVELVNHSGALSLDDFT